ncbi:uncharacterized protein IL334_000346 [Kwoniella shivajii]|uniref:Uncharacterized protein n=1 Tax=Kwoniella shivajii TaxID=564305 RepID=A0ABZ1CRY3_9TREE|nr:hypothetical protein IL334_000346 [Kwoniella shivajii]
MLRMDSHGQFEIHSRISLFAGHTVRPLPVERSQGSVSALVARFQTAANRDIEATARESRRASLQPSAGNSRRASSSGLFTPSPTPSNPTTPLIGSTDLPDTSAPTLIGEGEKDGSSLTEDPIVGKEKNGNDNQEKGQGQNTVENVLYKAGNTLKKVEDKFKNMTIQDDSEDKHTSKDVDQSSGILAKTKPKSIDTNIENKKDITPNTTILGGSPSRPPKSPKRMSSNTVMSSLAVPDTDPMQTKGDDHTLEEGLTDEAQRKKIQDKAKDLTPANTSNTPDRKPLSSTTKKPFPPSSSSASVSTKSPIAIKRGTTSASPATTPAATRSRLSSGPTSSSSSPHTRVSSTPRSRTSLGQSSTPTITPRSVNTKSSTSASASVQTKPRTPKPLIPSHTGPPPTSSTKSRISEGTTSGIGSPLKPHVIGTPSKPTASSLAKARIPTTPSLHSRLNTSPGASTEKRNPNSESSIRKSSIGTRGTSLSPSPSPATSTNTRIHTQTHTPSKVQNSGSRLLQGTAASRAKAADVSHRDPPALSSKDTPLKKISTPLASRSSALKGTANITTPSPATKTTSRSFAGESSSKPPSSTSSIRTRTKSATKSTSTEAPKIPSVGKSQIGRIGLAAARESPSSQKEHERKDAPTSDVIGHTNEDTARENDGDVDDEAKADLDRIVDNGNKAEGENGQIEDIVDRPKTPSPEIQGEQEAKDHIEQIESASQVGLPTTEHQSDLVRSEAAQMDSTKLRSGSNENRDSAVKPQDTIIANDAENGEEGFAGEESLEEIPDIE